MGEPAAPSVVEPLLAHALGEVVRCGAGLGQDRADRVTWAAEATTLGPLVVKARRGDRVDEKTRWAAEHLPLLGARGYPAPEIVWHGELDEEWYLVVERRLPGEAVLSLDPARLAAVLDLVELQADAGIEPDTRDFAAYQSFVLFEGWDYVWRDAEGASPNAAETCARLRRWLEPVWGLRLPATDFANNDLNLTNVLFEGDRPAGVVDWDEFGLNTRAADLIALAFDCERAGATEATETLLRRVVEIAGEGGARCVVAYRAIALLATFGRRGETEALAESVAATDRVLDRLE
jgi:aminoglycoside phosphotransferase (APT) family kinase protein